VRAAGRGVHRAVGSCWHAAGACRPIGTPAGAPGAGRGAPPDLPRRAAELVGAQFDAVAAAAEGSDAIVASGITPAAAAAWSVAEKLGIRYVYATYCPVWLPSPHHRPLGLPGRPFPPEVTDNRVLWNLEAQGMNAVFGPPFNTHRASIGLPPMETSATTSSPTARGWRRTRP